jgi:hypothetical protein
MSVGLLAAGTGCGILGTESGAPRYSDSIGSAVTTTSTVPPPTSDRPVRDQTGAVYRGLIEKSAPTVPDTVPVTIAAPEYCYQIQTFVFESTQMLLAEDAAAARARYDVAVTALDAAVAGSPPAIAEPAAAARQILVSTVDSPGTTGDVEDFRRRISEMAAGEFGRLFDGLFVEAVELCGDSLTDPYVSADEGVRKVIGQ